MKNFQRGFVNAWLMVIIITFLLVVGYFAFMKKSLSENQQNSAVQQVTNNIPNNQTSKTTNIVKTTSTTLSNSALVVLSPNSGESYKVGSQQTIKWSAPVSVPMVRIFLESISTHYAGGGVGGYIPDVHKILAQDAVNSGSYDVVIPSVPDGKYLILIEGIDNSGKPIVLSDSSDSFFNIAQ